MAAVLAAPIASKLGDQAAAFGANPWDYIADLLIEIGAFLLLVGIALGFVGYYLKAYSVKAKSDAAQGVATVEGVFGNVSFNAPQSPYLKVNGPNVANDITNLGNDAARLLTNTAGQAWADLKGIATAIDDIPKALVQMVSQGPAIAINGFLGLVSEALSDIFILVFPYAIIFGAGMLAAGIGMRCVRYVWDAYLAPEFGQWADTRIGAPLRAWAHRLLANPDSAPGPSQEAPAAAIPPVATPSPPEPVKPGSTAGSVPQVAPPPEAPNPDPTPENPPAAVYGAGPSSDKRPEGARETLPAVSTEVQEEQLGSALDTARDRMRAARRKKREAQPSEDYVGWAYSRIPASA
jgi:hypothetical protein